MKQVRALFIECNEYSFFVTSWRQCLTEGTFLLISRACNFIFIFLKALRRFSFCFWCIINTGNSLTYSPDLGQLRWSSSGYFVNSQAKELIFQPFSCLVSSPLFFLSSKQRTWIWRSWLDVPRASLKCDIMGVRSISHLSAFRSQGYTGYQKSELSYPLTSC